MKTFEQFLAEMIEISVSPHPSKPGIHVIGVKHNSSSPTQFPHTREIKSSDLKSEIEKIHKHLGKHNVTLTKHLQ